MATKINPFNNGHLDYVGGGGVGNTGTLSAGTTNATLGQVIFSNSNGISFGLNGQTLTASVNAAGGGLTNINISAGTTSNNLSALTFSNGGGVSFGLNGSVITATVATNYLTTAMASNRGTDFVQATAGFNGTNASGTIASDGISVSVGNYITTAMLSNAVTISNINVSAGTTSNNLSAITFNNGNGISFGLNASTVTASHNGLTSQSNQAFSAEGGSSAFQTIIFTNSNGISFSNTGGSIWGSHNGLTSQSNQNVTAGNGGFAFQTLSFSNLNGISFGTSAGSAITASHNALTSQSNQAFSADASSTFQTLSFQDSNGISFSNNGGALRLTHALQFTSNTSAITSNALNTSASRIINIIAATNNTGGGTASLSSNVSFSNANGLTFYTSAGNAVVGSYTVPTQTNQQMTMFATGNTTLSSTGTSNASSLIFRGSGAASIGITNGSILIDVAAGAAAITQSFGMSTQTAGGGTAGTTGYVTGDDILYHFVPGSNITMSQSINGASGTLSIYGPAAGGNNLSALNPFPDAAWTVAVQSNASLILYPIAVGNNFQHDRMVMPMHFSQATNSTLTVTNSIWWGWFTKNNNSMSLYKSGSGSFSINGSGTASSASNSGIRIVSFGSTDTITYGNYYLGLVWRSTTAGANASLSNLVVSVLGSSISGYIGSASVTNQPLFAGQGIWISTTAGMPNSLAFTDIRANSSAYQRTPIFYFTSGTT